MALKATVELTAKIKEATGLLEVAEHELKRVLEELKVFERADKQMVSKVIQTAFEKLAAARVTLEGLVDEDRRTH